MSTAAIPFCGVRALGCTRAVLISPIRGGIVDRELLEEHMPIGIRGYVCHLADQPALRGDRARDRDRVDVVGRVLVGRREGIAVLVDHVQTCPARRASGSTCHPWCPFRRPWQWARSRATKATGGSPGFRPGVEETVSKAMAFASTWIRHLYSRKQGRPTDLAHNSNTGPGSTRSQSPAGTGGFSVKGLLHTLLAVCDHNAVPDMPGDLVDLV